MQYEDDEILRVLQQDSLQNISEEDEDYFEVGDVILAEWLPTGKYFEARIIRKGSKFISLCY